MRKLRERIRISQQLLCDMEKDMRAMRYAQIAAKMKKRSLEVTDDLLDTFIQFAGNHQNGAGDTARSPARPPLLLRQLLQKNLRKKRAISSHMLRPESHPVASRGVAPDIPSVHIWPGRQGNIPVFRTGFLCIIRRPYTLSMVS